MCCLLKMTPDYENNNEDRREKTLDDIYRVIRSIDGKVEKILDEVCDLEYRPSAYDDEWSMRDFYENGEVY